MILASLALLGWALIYWFHIGVAEGEGLSIFAAGVPLHFILALFGGLTALYIVSCWAGGRSTRVPLVVLAVCAGVWTGVFF